MNVIMPKSGRPALWAIIASVLWGCTGEDTPGSGTGGGFIRPATQLNSSVLDSRASTEATDITADDLSITLTSADGKYNRTFASLANFKADERFTTGAYTMSAYYGSEDSEGFDSPWYYGETSFSVTDGEVTEVEVTATLANCMVSVEATEAFDYFFGGAYSTTLHSTGGEYLEIAAGESRPAYMRSGTVTVTASVTMPDTRKEATLEIGSFTAAPRTHYHVTLDVNNRHGSAQMVVTFDESTDLKPVTISLDPSLIDAPAPEVTLRGASEGTPVHTVTTVRPADDLRFDVVAPGHVRTMTLTTTNAPQLTTAGWPAEIDLANPTAEQKAQMEKFGLRAPGATMPEAQFAAVVLTDLVPNLRDSGATFTLRTVDSAGKASAPVSASVELDPLVCDLTSAKPLTLLAGEITVSLKYNGEADPATLTYAFDADGSGQWSNVQPSAVSPGAEAGLFDVTLPVGTEAYALELRAESPIGPGATLNVHRQIPELKITASEGNVWANRAYIALSCDELTDEQLVKLTTLYLSADNGRTYRTVPTEVQSNGLYLISGISPATVHMVKGSLMPRPELACTPVKFTTEAAAQVPNGDFESLTETINYNIIQGYSWTITVGGTHYWTRTDMTISEPVGWASTNCKTCALNIDDSQYPISTWYQVPSVYNTTLGWVVHQPTAKFIWGQDAYDEVPPIYDGLTAASGSNAMVVRNVAWDNQGEKLSVDSKTGNTSFSNYYCSKVPNISHRSAGRLFLGTNSFNGTTENSVQGVSFSSRPAMLSGSYMYATDDQMPDEKGVVTVKLLRGITTLATGSIELGQQSSFTTFEVPLTYTNTTMRPTTLCIEIKSSDRDDSQIVTTNYCNKQECTSRGAALTIDNLKFSY